MEVSIYDRRAQEVFLGHVRFSPLVDGKIAATDAWYPLKARDTAEEQVTGEIRLQLKYQKTDKKHYGPEDFQILKLIGKG
jgi:protein-serine/threonine kinase